jgi:Holliday junction resolvase
MKAEDAARLRRWRRRGFYSENSLVKLLKKNNFYAVRVPVSNPSLNPLPDIIARRGNHVYAFEVKNASYYVYFPKQQIQKLFEFLNRFIPTEEHCKHAVLAAHMGKRWVFREINWQVWRDDKLPQHERILKRDIGNFRLEMNREDEGARSPEASNDSLETQGIS